MSMRKPSTVGSSANPPSGSSLLKRSGGTFVMKLWRAMFGFGPHTVEEITGDGDDYTTYDHNGLLVGDYTLIGGVESGAAIGLQQLVGSSNPGTFKLLLDNSGAAGSVQTVTALVRRIQGDWYRRGVYIPLIVRTTVTATNPATIEGSS